jgi:hypothetical protein
VKTPEDYYKYFVERVFDTTIKSLHEHEDRTFTCADMFFFKKWYDGASPL